MENILPVEIINKIIGNLDTVKDLINCRLVNRRWNNLAAEQLKSTHKLIRFTDDIFLFDFLDCFESSIQGFPFSKFHFQLDKINYSDDVLIKTQKHRLHIRELSFELRVKNISLTDLIKVRQMIRLITLSPYLTHLQMNIGGRMPVTSVDPEVLILGHETFDWCSSIRSIQLNRDIGIVGPDICFILIILKLLKNASQNLNEIIISPWKGTRLSRIMPLLHVFKDTERVIVRNVSFLTHDSSEIEVLRDKTCKLTELNLRMKHDFDKADDNPNFNYDTVRLAFYQWLEHHSKTMKNLTLILEEVSEFKLPPMEALESLNVGLGTYDDLDLGNPLLPFHPSQFPKLRSVTLNFYSEDWNFFHSEEFLTVKSLKFQGYQEEFVRERWDKIFPNVKTLELACFKPLQLKQILSQMVTVHHLKLELCQNMTSQPELILPPSVQELGELSIAPVSPKFASLQLLESYSQLKSLYITGGGESAAAQIVQMSQDELLKNLVNLTLIGHTISAEHLQILKSVHGFVWC